MRQIVIERTYEHPLTEAEKRIFPAGWAGPVEPEIAAAIVEAGAGRIDPDREAEVEAAEAATAEAEEEEAAAEAARLAAEAQGGASRGKGRAKGASDETAAADDLGV